MLLAVLEKKAGLPLINQDVYVNIVGGLKPEGTSADLAVALAIYSSFKGISAGQKTLAIGEIGLTGDLRTVRYADKIVKEAARMGYKRVILPRSCLRNLKEPPAECSIIGARNITEAIAAFAKKQK